MNLADLLTYKWLAKSAEERFWKAIRKSNESGACWEWIGRTNADGYGSFRIGCRKEYKAHRLMWFIIKGKFPDGHLLHSCDNPACVRIEHLREGTQSENMRDMAAKGRSALGVRNVRARLDEKKVREIRAKCTMGIPHKILASEFGVTRSTIWHIAENRTWRHLR